MRFVLFVLPCVLLGCEPPEKVDLDDDSGVATAPAEPLIRVVHPQNGSEVSLDDNCDLNMIVAVQIEDFTLVDFDENPTPAPGEGHWHVQIIGETGYEPIREGQSVEVVRTGFVTGTFQVEVSLVNSQHQTIAEGQSSHRAELTAVAPTGVVCN